ncbi:hypothetical protein [Sphingomonas sp. MMS24-J13]|uniref:hypothetical protein n=1 Tax=Sphingomonas sp. MMS24-J13 TaxID=3238686 RepID=UPI00384F58D1
MSIVISGAGSNPALPLDQSYADQILASPALVEWFDSGTYTLGTAPAVQTLISRKPGGRTLGQAASGNRPALSAAGAIGSYSEITFTGAQVMRMSSTIDLTQPFTWVAVMRFVASNSTTSIVDNQNGSARSSLILTSQGYLAFAQGNGIAAMSTPPSVGWHFIVCGHDGNTASIAVDGGTAVTHATDNNASTLVLELGANNASLTYPLTGGFADLIMLSGSPTANAALIELIKTYCRAAYGSSVSIA